MADDGLDRDFNEDDNQDEGEFTFGQAQGTGAELLELLKARKFTKVIELLDVPVNYPEKEEVAFLVDLANDVSSTSHLKVLHENLFVFLCSVAGASLTTSILSSIELLKQYQIQFEVALSNCHLSDLFRNGILSSFPTGFLLLH